MITYDEAMARASDPSTRELREAVHWLNVARELREASAGPFLDRLLQRADDALPAQAQLMPAVQDVEAEICGDHEAIAVRLPGASSRWWHPRLRTWCDGPDPVTSTSARIPMPVATRDQEAAGGETQRIDERLRIPLPVEAATEVMGALRNCYNCGQTIAYDETVKGWRHVASGQRVCIGDQQADDQTAVYAWPASVGVSG